MSNLNNNRILDFFKQTLELNISDIHLLQDDYVYIRNASWDILPQDIKFSAEEIFWFLHSFLSVDKVDTLLDGNEIDVSHTINDTRFRINAYYDKNWIRLAMRKISKNPPSMRQIWLKDDIQKYLMEDKWLILVTWPTGSWKSTTLASMIEYVNENRNAHIITLEDPIEYIYENKKSLITQREIWKNSNSWTNAMKYSMRQDPDIIMVGEMRDLETIAAVLTLVETGHLVFSTLHTVDAAQTITRIIDVFPPHQQEQIAVQLSLTLRLIISQRLVPASNWWRVAAREILVNTPAVANNIRERKIPQIFSIMETWLKTWMISMDQSLAYLVAAWLVKEEDVLSKIKNIWSFRVLLDNLKNAKSRFNPVD